MTLSALTLQELIRRMRTQLRRYAPSVELEADEARHYANLGYMYYLLRLGVAKESDLVVRQAPVNITKGTYEYGIPPALLSITAVAIRYQGREFYLFRRDPKLGAETIDTASFPSTSGWNPTVKILGRKIHLLPVPPMDVSGGLILEGTQFPAPLVQPTDAVDPVLHPAFHTLVELRAVLVALKSQEQQEHYRKVETTLMEMEAMFDSLTSNRSTLREFVEDASYMEV